MSYRVLCIFAVCLFAPVIALADDKGTNDAKSLQGTWQAVTVEANGDKLPDDQAKELQIVIKGDEFVSVKPSGEDPKNKFKLDSSKTPKTIDLAPIDGPNKGKTFAGIYSLKDGQLRLCINIFGQDTTQRPKEFKTKEGDGVGFAILERAKHTTLGAESPSALEADPEGWVDILPSVDLKGWYRVAVPPTGKLGRQQWHAEPDQKMLVCDGDGGHDMLLFEKEFGDAIFHFEFRYVPVEGKTGYNSGAYVRNSRDGSIWHQAQFGDAKDGYLFGETPTAGGKKKFFSLEKEVKDMRVKPVGHWNTMEVTARGKTLTLWVNGAVTCQFRDCGQEKGRVGVEGEGYRIEFRNLKVKELR